jgi:hypothetical protein
MTKSSILLFLGVVWLILFPSVVKSQKLSFSEYTGVNFSNLHGNLTSNKWVPKTGASTGFVVEYNFNRLFSVQSEISFISQYYEMKTYRQQPTYTDTYYPIPFTSCIIGPVYEPSKWDFSFLRFPIILKYKTPTRLQLGVGGGVFYSVLMNDDITEAERKAAEKEDRRIYPPTHDWGYLFTTDLSYPVTDGLRLFLAGRLSFGQKVFIESYKAKNGASELLVGVKYSPRHKQNKAINDFEVSDPDSSFIRCYLKPVIGAAMSWNSAKKQLGNYSENYGSKAGLIFGYRAGKVVSLQTGFQFQQKGYAFSDSSFFNHRYATDIKRLGRRVDTHVNFDYLTIPVNLNFSFGNRISWYFELGTYADFMLNASCIGTTIYEYRNGSSYRLEKHTLRDAAEGYYKTLDWGYSAGLGIQFPISGNTKLDIGMHYQRGLKNVLKNPNENEFKGYYDDLTFKNSSLSFQVGLQIPFQN